MTDIDENLEGAFGDSRKNNFDENSEFNLELEINALLEAKKLRQYVDTKEMEKLMPLITKKDLWLNFLKILLKK